MASKIKSHHVYVAITPYKVDGSSAEEFNELDVMTAYDDRAKHFYVNLHPGWKTDYGHGCFLYGGDDPLTSSKWMKVKDSPKNSQKTINEIGAAMEMAKDAIAWLFDKRDWQRLYVAVRNIALNGYTEQYRQQMEQLMNNTNNQNSEDNTMRLNMDANKSENQNVAMEPQVNNNTATAIEDAVAVEIKDDVDVAEVNDIVPKVTPSRPPRVEEKPAVTMPLGQHGTLVIAGVGGTKSEPKPKKEEDTKPRFDLEKDKGYRVVLVPAKDGSGEWPKLYGFQTEEEAEKIAGKMAKSIRNTWDRDEKNEKRFYIKGGKKYCEVFQRLCDALNAGNKAAIDAACKDSVAVYEGAVADGKQKREERKAAREANTDKTDKTDKPAAPAMDEKEQAMFELFKKFMAGDKSAMEQVGTMMTKKAA